MYRVVFIVWKRKSLSEHDRYSAYTDQKVFFKNDLIYMY